MTSTKKIDDILQSEFPDEFIQLMRNRTVMGTLRYGPSAKNVKFKSALSWLKERLAEYDRTGNTELLVDVANFAKMEWMHLSKAGAHFKVVTERKADERRWTVKGMYNWFYRHDGG